MDAFLKKHVIKASPSMRVFLSELMGTTVLIMLAIGVSAQSVLSNGELGGFLSINIGGALAVTFGVYWSLGVSGGHLNPAVTLANVMAGRLPLRRLPIYWLAQTLGTFIASAFCFFIYQDLLNMTDGGKRTIKTAGIWTTYPKGGVSHVTVFIDQVVGTGLLVGAEFALCDKNSKTTKIAFLPAVVGLLVLGIGTSFGTNCGYGINPTRDLIPRVFTSIAGWKTEPFKFDDYYFWIPVLGQISGAVIGAITYMIAIEMHHPDPAEVNVTKSVVPKHPEIIPSKSVSAPPDIVIDIPAKFVYDNPIAHESVI